MDFDIGTIIKEISTSKVAIIVGTKERPYVSPIDFSKKTPKDDFLIKYKNNQGDFSGQSKNVKLNQIELI